MSISNYIELAFMFFTAVSGSALYFTLKKQIDCVWSDCEIIASSEVKGKRID